MDIAKECNLDVDLGEQARALHRVVRAMHDGHCPSCGHLASADSFYQTAITNPQHPKGVRPNQHCCPSCNFTITEEQAELALAAFRPYLNKSVEVFEQWRNTLKQTNDEVDSRRILQKSRDTPESVDKFTQGRFYSDENLAQVKASTTEDDFQVDQATLIKTMQTKSASTKSFIIGIAFSKADAKLFEHSKNMLQQLITTSAALNEILPSVKDVVTKSHIRHEIRSIEITIAQLRRHYAIS